VSSRLTKQAGSSHGMHWRRRSAVIATLKSTGRSFSCLYTEAQVADGQPAQALARSIAHGRSEEQAPRRRPDGSSFWADVTITAVHDAAGNHCGFACVVRDFSAHSSTEQELQSRLN
jgi:PAS domain S-box-containing protein